MYGNGEYSEAAELYAGQAAFRESIQIMDTNAIFNAALSYDYSKQYEKAVPMYLKLAEIKYKGTQCYVYASSSYRKSGETAKAKALIAKAREGNPTDKDLLLEVVNTSIEEGDAAAAESALAGAIENDPLNKQLHYTIGTIMIDLGSGALAMHGDSVARSFDEKLALKEKSESYYTKAEAALNKALEIDPDYVDAQYQQGAHLVTWAGIIKTEASKLPYGDASYQLLEDRGEATYKRALVPLEKYIAAFPKDKSVLTILFQIERNLKNTEKALAYKKRADAIPD
jgi:tetratricopeptide (TPR) repeat protein